MNIRRASASLLAALALAACDSGSSGTDASVGVDAVVPMDAPAADAPATDAAATDAPAVVDAFVTPEVAACRTETARAGAICAAEMDRSCFFAEYARLCDEGRAEAITDSMECFTTATCHTFGDPGETAVGTCLAASYAAHARTESTATRTAYCARCPASSACAAGGDGAIGVPFEHLSDARLTSLTTCFTAAGDCDGASACFLAELPELAGCFD